MKNKTYKIENETIVIDREITELDTFVKDFLNILKKHSEYLIVSGFVSISTGRVRGTEDVDVLMPLGNLTDFKLLFEELNKNNFWCYQTDKSEVAYNYLTKFSSIRFARKNQMFPNMEVVPITPDNKIKYFEFMHPKKIRIKDFEFKIPPIEFEILYKEIILGSKKDKEDAMHLRTYFAEILDENKFKEYGKVIKNEI